RLDRFGEPDPPALDLDRVPFQELHDVLRGHRAQELALLGGLPALLVRERVDPVAQRLRLALDAICLGVLLPLDLLEVLEVARGGAEGELLRDQIVARVAVGDVANLATAPDLGDIVQQNDSHRSPSYSVARYGRRATVRARLIACVSWRWCRAQLPEIRRGMILPRSLTKLLSRRTSLSSTRLTLSAQNLQHFRRPDRRRLQGIEAVCTDRDTMVVGYTCGVTFA